MPPRLGEFSYTCTMHKGINTSLACLGDKYSRSQPGCTLYLNGMPFTLQLPGCHESCSSRTYDGLTCKQTGSQYIPAIYSAVQKCVGTRCKAIHLYNCRHASPHSAMSPTVSFVTAMENLLNIMMSKNVS